MAACAITVTRERSEVVDFLASHWEDKIVIAVKHTSDKWRYFTQIYASGTWLALFFTPLFMALAHLIFVSTFPTNVIDKACRLLVYNFTESIFTFYGNMLLQGKLRTSTCLSFEMYFLYYSFVVVLFKAAAIVPIVIL